MAWLISLLILAAAAGVMLWLSSPLELRPQRKWKMLVSLPMLAIAILIFQYAADNLVAAIGQVTFYAFFIGIPAVIWTPNINWFAARFFSEVLQGAGRAGGGFRPEFSLVKHYLKEGKPDEAFEALNEQLDKDRKNYEGLLLLAQIWLDKKQPWEAVKALEVIINNPGATDEQRAIAKSEKQRIEFEFAPAANSSEAPPKS